MTSDYPELTEDDAAEMLEDQSEQNDVSAGMLAPKEAQPDLSFEGNVISDSDPVHESLARSLVTLGFVAFDGQGTDNTSSHVLVSQELRQHFRRDALCRCRGRGTEDNFPRTAW